MPTINAEIEVRDESGNVIMAEKTRRQLELIIDRLAKFFNVESFELWNILSNMPDAQEEPLTLRSVIVQSLRMRDQEDRQAGFDEIYSRGEVIFKIANSPAYADLKPSEIEMIKKAVARYYNPVVVYRVAKLLDGDAHVQSEKKKAKNRRDS